jgi:hypothetical protein
MFNLQRFLKLAKAQWAEHRKSYLWFFLIGVIVHFCTMMIGWVGNASFSFMRTETQMLIYMTGFFITAPLFAGRYLEKISSRDSALTVLMRPASVQEKFLLAFLMITVFYPIAYTAAFQICNLPSSWIALANSIADIDNTKYYSDAANYATYLPFIRSKIPAGELAMFIMVWTLQAYMLAGTLFFKRFAMLKSFVLGFVLFLGLVFFTIIFNGNPERLFHLWDSEKFIPSGFFAWLVVLWVGIPLLTWASAFFFLKQRELH